MADIPDPLSTLIIGLGGSGAWTSVHVKKQLLDTYDEIPENIGIGVLDTAATTVARIGQVELAPHEYSHIGGDSHQIAYDVVHTNNYPHIGTWFLADQYLKKLPTAVFRLDQGAGQFRQFGRLALFKDVMTPAQSEIARVVDQKLTRIARNAPAGSPAISVHVIGSLVGGTGAGLFLDIPHLIRRVAANNNFRVIVRAFLFLPQAFRRTLNAQDLEAAKPRAFAAMRELSRFQLNEDYQFGYPMYYHSERAGVNHELWRAKVESKLYDFVYLLDGEGPTKISARDFSMGSASVVADTIMSYIDGYYGNHLEQYNANIQAKVVNRQDEVGRMAFVGTVGSYSIILPVRQMIEGWSYQLGEEVLRSIAPGSRHDTQQHITQLSEVGDDKNPLRLKADEEVERLMTTNTDIVDPNDPNDRRISPTSLWRPIYQFYAERRENEQRLARKLDSVYDLEDWLGILIPPSLETDPGTRRLIGETTSILGETIRDYTLPSNERNPKGTPASDHKNIKSQAEKFVERQLGLPGKGGSRRGGFYEQALARFIDFQSERFREYIAAYMMNTLNGYSARDPEEGKAGKLGWLMGVMRTWQQMFASVEELLEQVRQGTVQGEMQAQRGALEDSYNDALTEMVKKANETAWIGEAPSITAQKAFMDQAQGYVDYYRKLYARDAVAQVVRQVGVFLGAILEELQHWGTVLALDTHSLHAELLDGRNRMAVERQRAESVANHRIINDQAWETARYQEYVENAEAKRAFFEAWNWQCKLVVDDRSKQPVVIVEATLNGKSFRSDNKGRWNQENCELVLDFSRRIFRTAAERESVLGYLMNEQYRDNARGLGQELKENAGYLLTLRQSHLNNGRIPTNALLAFHDDKDTRHRQFLNEVLGNLASLEDANEDTSNLHKIMECTDPYRLTLISAAELVPLEGIQAYMEYNAPYLRLPYDARQRTHIFPAEVRSALYEELVESVLEQPKRILQERVSFLLENEERFKEFLQLFAYGVVKRIPNPEDRSGAQKHFIYALVAPSESSRRGEEMDIWWLTEAEAKPSLLNAMLTYVIREKDFRSFRQEGAIAKPISYRHILDYLKKVRDGDTAQRIKDDNLALKEAKLRKYLEYGFMPPVDDDGNEVTDDWTDADEDEFLEVASVIAMYDNLQKLSRALRKELPELEEVAQKSRTGYQTGQGHDAFVRHQEEYDLYSITIIALETEMDQNFAIVKDKYDRKVEDEGN